MSVRLRVRVWVRIRVSVRVSTPMFAIAPLKLHISHDYLRSVTTGTSEPRLWKQKHAAAPTWLKNPGLRQPEISLFERG